MNDNSLRDVIVYGRFKFHRWDFIVHQDVHDPECFAVSEASTGRMISDYYYSDLESAVKSCYSLIEDKRYYLDSLIGDILVNTQVNLSRRNISPFTLWTL